MPAGWKPDRPVDYLIVTESFHLGGFPFEVGRHIRGNHPLANKLLYECPEWVHPVWISELG